MKELRTIIFDETEAAHAVVEFCRRVGRKLPSGTLKSFDVSDSGETVSAVMRVTDDDGAVHDVTLGQGEVAAALVGYCLTRSIPLPKNASKIITGVDNQIVLAIEVGHADDARKLVRAVRGRSV